MAPRQVMHRQPPQPLLVEALLNGFDSDVQQQVSSIRSRAEFSTEVPVRGTFIDFKSPSIIDENPRGRQATLSACTSLSIRALLDCWDEDVRSVSTRSSWDASPFMEKPDCSVPGPMTPASTPLVYKMSPISAKAAGYWDVETSYYDSPSSSLPANDSDLYFPQADMEAEAEVSSTRDSPEDSDSREGDKGPCPLYSMGVLLPSAGSALHGEGRCKRCCFFPKGRCTNGEDCRFCHFLHERRKPNKKKTKVRRKDSMGSYGVQHRFEAGPTSESLPTAGPQDQDFVMPMMMLGQAMVPESYAAPAGMILYPAPYGY